MRYLASALAMALIRKYFQDFENERRSLVEIVQQDGPNVPGYFRLELVNKLPPIFVDKSKKGTLQVCRRKSLPCVT